MNRLFTEGVVYKLTKYTDQSAIALAYTPEFGKLKLFIPRAFSKKGGVTAFVPGEIDFLKKENSDLNKLYSFRPDPVFIGFVENPQISLRLNLLFDVFDALYETEQKELVLWTLIKKFRTEEPGRVLIFSVYAMLKNSGIMFDPSKCSYCGKEIENFGALSHGLYYCGDCAPEVSFKTGGDVNLILRSLGKRELYGKLKISRYQEFAVLDLFAVHIASSSGKSLKSYGAFKELVAGL